MLRLTCSASNCINYMNGMCTAETIEVKGNSAEKKSETQCETFAPRTLGNALKNAFNTNYAGALMQAIDSNHDITHEVKCNAIDCTYNVANKCTSTDIQIYGPEASTSQGTECETFFLK